MRNQRSEVRSQNFQSLEVCARLVSNHWKAAVACCLLALCAACSERSELPSTVASLRARLEAVYPVLRPLIVSKPTLDEFVAASLKELMGTERDQERRLKVYEVNAAAWRRFAATRTITPKQELVGGNVFFLGFAAADVVCEKVEPKGKECLTEKDVAELVRLMSEEADKRGLRQDSVGQYSWKSEPTRS